MELSKADNPKMITSKGDTLNVAEKTHFSDWFNFAHISVAIPNALDVPAAWEASQSGQMRLEGKNSRDLKAVQPKA